MKKYKKYSDFDEDVEFSRDERHQRLKEKRVQSALRSKNYNELIDIEDDY